jgi:hypothetical protein
MSERGAGPTFGAAGASPPIVAQPAPLPVSPAPDLGALDAPIWERSCFFSAPIDEPESAERQHSDLLLDSLIRPALSDVDPKLGVLRGDQLPSSPITSEIYSHVARSGLLIADLSFHKPNVLMEVGLRYASGRPMVLVIREEDKIPSNLGDVRVVRLKATAAHEFWKALPESRAAIAERARWALSAEGRAVARRGARAAWV